MGNERGNEWDRSLIKAPYTNGVEVRDARRDKNEHNLRRQCCHDNKLCWPCPHDFPGAIQDQSYFHKNY